DLSNAIVSACDRFVHPAVERETARDRARRLVGLMFFAPVVLGAATAALVASHFGAASAMAAVLFIFATGWLGVLSIAGIRTSRWLERLALALSVPACGALLFAAGGLGSPAALLLLALPVEAFWV